MVKQIVTPIRNDFGKVIAVLIMEKDIMNDISQNKNMAILSETAQQLSQTLLNFHDNDDETNVIYHLNDAILMFDENAISDLC